MDGFLITASTSGTVGTHWSHYPIVRQLVWDHHKFLPCLRFMNWAVHLWLYCPITHLKDGVDCKSIQTNKHLLLHEPSACVLADNCNVLYFKNTPFEFPVSIVWVTVRSWSLIIGCTFGPGWFWCFLQTSCWVSLCLLNGFCVIQYSIRCCWYISKHATFYCC